MATLPPHSVPLLRICTEKSVVGFGRYPTSTVGEILNIDPNYLVYLYYSYDKFSLKDEIIQKLAIKKIKKPGTDKVYLKERNTKLFNERTKNMSQAEKENERKRGKARRGGYHHRFNDNFDSNVLPKNVLQAINHGKLKID